MSTLLLLQLLSCTTLTAINNEDTVNFIRPKVLIIVNNEVIGLGDVYVVKYRNETALDTLFGYYSLGSFIFVEHEVDRFIALTCDTTILNVSVWDLKSSFKRAPKEYLFAIGYHDYWLTGTDHMQVYQFENMCIKYFRRKRNIRSKSGFYFIKTNHQRHIEIDRYVR